VLLLRICCWSELLRAKEQRLVLVLVLAAPGIVDAGAGSHAAATALRLADMRRSTRSMAREEADDDIGSAGGG
jgi:hypothetical protein